MVKYKQCNFNRSVLISVCLDEPLLPGTLEYAIHYPIENLFDILFLTTNTKTIRQAAQIEILKFC